jgi:hypothetical protein
MAIGYTPSNQTVNKESYLNKGVRGTPERYRVQDLKK